MSDEKDEKDDLNVILPIGEEPEAEVEDDKSHLKVQMGVLTNPDEFDIGLDGDSQTIVIMFRQEGEPMRALGFQDEAADKLLTSFYALLSLLHGSGAGMEELANAPVNKKLTTLH